MLLPPMGFDYRLSGVAIDNLTQELITRLYKASEDVIAIPADARNFSNTLEAWHEVQGNIATLQVQATLPAMVSTDAEARVHSSAAKEKLKDAFDSIYARHDLYKVFKGFSMDESISSKQRRLLDATLRIFRSNGAELEETERARLMHLRAELNSLEFRFQQNLNEDTTNIWLTYEQLNGCSKKFIEGLEQDSQNRYKVTMKPPHLLEVLEQANDSEVRRQVVTARDQRCMDVNMPLLAQILQLRYSIAQLLGEPSHAHARLKHNMAKEPHLANSLLTSVLNQLKPLADAELHQLRRLKQKHTNSTQPENEIVISLWDIPFYTRILREQTALLDEQVLLQYFPLEHVRDEIFRLYEEILRVRITPSEVPLPTWHEDVFGYSVIDAENQELLGYFYLDLYPRNGKYSHQCVVPLCPVFRRSNGALQLPVAANIGNLSKPTATSPSLLHHSQVLTFFHEFGHVMHCLSTRSDYSLLSWGWSVVPYPAGVELDFLEVPSQALENWTWEKDVLKRLGRHVTTGESIPENLIDKLQSTKMIGKGIRYRRQIFLSLLDLHLHGSDTKVFASEQTVSEAFHQFHREIVGLEPVASTMPLASFYHIVQGYDSGYYSYLWSEVYSCDVYQKFVESQGGCMNNEIGLLYRRHILEPGATKDGNEMLLAFLERQPNQNAFNKMLGSSS